MSKRHIPMLIVFSASLTFLINSCKKENKENDCGPTGGVVLLNTYRFWTSIPMYNTTVELKDDTGTSVSVSNKNTAIYYISPSTGWEPEPCTYDETKEAVYSLSRGKTYTYTATNGTRKWTGVVNVPCVQNTCNNIEIK